MPIQVTEVIELGQVLVSKNRALMMTVPNLSASIVVVMYDGQSKVGGLAHIALPDSHLDTGTAWQQENPGKYADFALPYLWEKLQAEGGKKENTSVKVIGGAQMFNFNGGAGNALNVGSRNLVVIRMGLSKLGLALDKADTGGNKAKQLRFMLALGQVAIRRIGETEEYSL